MITPPCLFHPRQPSEAWPKEDHSLHLGLHLGLSLQRHMSTHAHTYVHAHTHVSTHTHTRTHPSEPCRATTLDTKFPEGDSPQMLK